MALGTAHVLFLLLFFITVVEGGKKSIEKIIIHVPYKIHKHHHTHTKYKVITMPSPKKENTIIYLKENIQPMVKHVPPLQTPQLEMTETQPETYEFIPPHQQSSSALLDSITNHKNKNLMQTDQEVQYGTIINDQKPLESHLQQNPQGFMQNFIFKPVPVSSDNKLIPNFSFNPPALPPDQSFTSKLLMNPIVEQTYNSFLPKFMYQPVLHLPQAYSNPKFTDKSKLLPSKELHDSAHTSSEVYKSIIKIPKPKTSYEVKETPEEHNIHLAKHHYKNSETFPVPSLKPIRKQKGYHHSNHKYQFNHRGNSIQSVPDYEYEHVGYLIIDDNAKKFVGKNFKDEIHLTG